MRVVALLLAIAPLASAAPKPGDEGTPEFDKATALVKQLGHPRFASREAAAKQLLEMGGTAIGALTVGTKSEDEEVRSRSTALLPQAKAAGWIRRAVAYLADSEGKEKHDLPLLAEWEKLIGKPDVGTRKLYAEMIRTSGEFLESAVGPKASAALLKQTKAIRERVRNSPGQLKAEPGELAAVLFVDAIGAEAVGDGPQARRGARGALAPLIANPTWPEALDAADTGPALRRLLVRWADFKGSRDASAAQQFAALVRKKPFPEAAAPLIKLVQDKKADVLSVRVLAIEALGKVGGADAAKTLTAMIADTTNVFGGGEEEHRLGDAALAAVITMSGKKLSDYGLDSNVGIGFGTDDGDESISLSLYGFRSQDARKKAIQKWQDEIAKKKDK